jgi:magnesium chelatase subunit ChlI-like protein
MRETSKPIRSRVQAALDIHRKRFGVRSLSTLRRNRETLQSVVCNADMRVEEIWQCCRLQDDCQGLMRAAMSELRQSAHAYQRRLELARTIADLAGGGDIQSTHLAAVFQYRSKLMMSQELSCLTSRVKPQLIEIELAFREVYSGPGKIRHAHHRCMSNSHPANLFGPTFLRPVFGIINGDEV